MPRDLDNIVAENRKSFRRTQTRFVSIETDEGTGLFFGTSLVEATVSTTIEARDEASTDPADWSAVSTTRQSGTVVNGGRSLIASSLNGAGDTLGAVVYGTDTTDATRFDTALGTETGSIAQDTATDSSNTVVVTTAAQNDETVFEGDFEVGLEDASGNLLTREVYSGPVDITDTDEVRAVVTVTLTGKPDGQSVYTTYGLNRMAQAIVGSTIRCFRRWDFSDVADGVDASDTSIANVAFSNVVSVTVQNYDVEVRTDVTTDDTPSSGFPYDIVESGVVDEGVQNLVWGSPNATLTVESNTEFVAEHTTRIVV